jgi:hypothetical protein
MNSKRKQEKLEEKAVQKERDFTLFQIRQLDLFPGTLLEYNQFKGLEYQIMDTKRPEKFVRLINEQEIGETSEDNLLIEIYYRGCEGFIHYHPNIRAYGIPVMKK